MEKDSLSEDTSFTFSFIFIHIHWAFLTVTSLDQVRQLASEVAALAISSKNGLPTSSMLIGPLLAIITIMTAELEAVAVEEAAAQ